MNATDPQEELGKHVALLFPSLICQFQMAPVCAAPSLSPVLGLWAPTVARRQALPISLWVSGRIATQKAWLLGLSLWPSRPPRLLLGSLQQVEEFAGLAALP